VRAKLAVIGYPLLVNEVGSQWSEAQYKVESRIEKVELLGAWDQKGKGYRLSVISYWETAGTNGPQIIR
jgi:hypothetical protein